MYGKLKEFLTNELEGIKAAGLYKNERIITTPQRADIKVNAGSDVLNFFTFLILSVTIILVV